MYVCVIDAKIWFLVSLIFLKLKREFLFYKKKYLLVKEIRRMVLVSLRLVRRYMSVYVQIMVKNVDLIFLGKVAIYFWQAALAEARDFIFLQEKACYNNATIGGWICCVLVYSTSIALPPPHNNQPSNIFRKWFFREQVFQEKISPFWSGKDWTWLLKKK